MWQKLMANGISKFLLIAAVVAIVTASGVGIYNAAHSKKTPGEEPVLVTRQTPSSSPTAIINSSPTVAASPVAKPKVQTTAPVTTAAPSAQASSTVVPPTKNPNEPPLLLKGIGINLDYYDPATGKAGDLVFTKEKLQFGVLFTEFGFTIPGNQSSTGQDKRNPQPTWQAPMGTKVHAIVDGVVVDIPTLYSGDYSIMVAPDTSSQWRYETEHVINPLVKVGDKVTAGQVIAEVSPHYKDGNAGYGLVEIGILKGGNPPQHICPFNYLDPSIKDDVNKKLLAFYKSWEEYRGDTNLHNEAAQPQPGCLSSDAIDG